MNKIKTRKYFLIDFRNYKNMIFWGHTKNRYGPNQANRMSGMGQTEQTKIGYGPEWWRDPNSVQTMIEGCTRSPFQDTFLSDPNLSWATDLNLGIDFQRMTLKETETEQKGNIVIHWH